MWENRRGVKVLVFALAYGLAGGAAHAQVDGGVASATVRARVEMVAPERLKALLDKLTGAADVTVGDGGPRRIRSRSVRHPDVKLAEDFLAAELSSLGLSVQRLPVSAPMLNAPLANVEATLLGATSPGEIYLLAAHYDSTARLTRGHVDATDAAPGADDDGTGVALVLEAARVLKDSKPRATIRFVLFTAEEEGIFGSDGYAKAARLRGDDIRFALSLDPVGNSGPLGGNLYVTYDHPSEDLAHVVQGARDRYGIALPVLIVPGDSSLFPDDRSDHRSFWAAGYKALHAGSLPGDAYHTVLDTAEKVDVPFLADATRVVVAFFGDVAGPLAAPAAPPAAPSPKPGGCAVVGELGARACTAVAPWLAIAACFLRMRRRSRRVLRGLGHGGNGGDGGRGGRRRT